MLHAVYFLGTMSGLAVGMVIFYTVGARRRARIPGFVWWMCILVGVVTTLYSLANSTAPSVAPRIAIAGKAYDCVAYRQGKSTKYGFRLVPEGGPPVQLETILIMPSWASPENFNGRVLKVVYLKDDNRDPRNEAISISILSGKHAGWHDAVDARPFGTWLGMPIGAMLGTMGLFGSRYRKDDLAEAIEE